MVFEALNRSLCFETHIISFARAIIPLFSRSYFVFPLTTRTWSSAKACRNHPSGSSSSSAVSRTMFQRRVHYKNLLEPLFLQENTIFGHCDYIPRCDL
ncbi:hypothetical protein AVEN_78605-1 [Araneus ventricosus]|uniref:Uncharacterized protein n=1 Tax=Araneus ventricosus TaxID=182803 RepID=A0A4Y2FYR5_ARAVE|nr:hypothetical protein AVEN_78605-1 [Araneus ventricosus]